MELGIEDIDLFTNEIPWLTNKILMTSNLRLHGDWVALFGDILNAAAGVERVRTVVGWAAGIGTTKLQLLRKAYHEHPNFDWHAVDNAFPGELNHARTTQIVLTNEPYRAFYSPQPAGAWQPTAFQNAAHVALLVLEAVGEATVSGYKGLQNHTLFGLPTWKASAAAYAANYSALRIGNPDKYGHASTPAHRPAIERVNFPLQSDC